MEKPNGHYGWMAIGTFVVAWDLYASETLSSAFRRGGWPARALGAYTLAHLVGALPEQADGFKVLLDRAQQKTPDSMRDSPGPDEINKAP